MDDPVAFWLDQDPDPETQQELQTLLAEGKIADVQARFAGRLAFGTAGLRARMGAGPMRMNRLVVRQSSAGLASYLRTHVPDAATRGVVIGYDGRLRSQLFANDAACVLGAMGLRVHLFDMPMPTPVCAFARDHLNAAAAVVITASHNPPAYNGYKVFWHDGAQIRAPHDTGIAHCIAQAAQAAVPYTDRAVLAQEGLLRAVGQDTVDAYLRGIAALSIHPLNPTRAGLSIAYTPLHGVGAPIAERALAQQGFTRLHTVPSQRDPDGAFPTVSFPNPEEPEAMRALLHLATEIDADIACANDPDADRLAVAVRLSPGDYAILTGDQLGVILATDRLNASPGATVATTVVSSRLLAKIAADRGSPCRITLTGFKWLAAAAIKEQAEGRPFAFAYEEALGFSIGTLVRDKDGLSALVSIAELSAALKDEGMTLLDYLLGIYQKHGVYLTAQRSLDLDPDRPSPTAVWRCASPRVIAGRAIATQRDLRNATASVDLPSSDVLIYELVDRTRVIIRPSGTEPKLKCYYEVCEDVDESDAVADVLARTQKRLHEVIAAHQHEVRVLCGA